MLQVRSRAAWIFRVFYDMSSKQIATHPEVGVAAPHVDVIVHRAREAVGNCLTRKGHRSRELPHGAFVEAWLALRSLTPMHTEQA